MSAIERILPYYTYEDYKQWEGRWEIIDGIPYAMAALPIPMHQLIASNLLALFWHELKDCAPCKVYQPLDYVVKADTVIQPDMLVVCRDFLHQPYLDFPPSLVCEVISPSTALKDRHTKYNIYQSQKIPYYIIVSPKTEEVEIYMLDKEEYRLSQKGRNIKVKFTLDHCEIEIDFEKIW